MSVRTIYTCDRCGREQVIKESGASQIMPKVTVEAFSGSLCLLKESRDGNFCVHCTTELKSRVKLCVENWYSETEEEPL